MWVLRQLVIWGSICGFALLVAVLVFGCRHVPETPFDPATSTTTIVWGASQGDPPEDIIP